MEKIICAAVWYKEMDLKKDLPAHSRNPINCEEGIVFCGHRHGQCIFSMVALTGLRQCEAGEEIQGFLTNKNRFVNRIEAAEIAITSQQITKTNWGNELYSEDLY